MPTKTTLSLKNAEPENSPNTKDGSASAGGRATSQSYAESGIGDNNNTRTSAKKRSSVPAITIPRMSETPEQKTLWGNTPANTAGTRKESKRTIKKSKPAIKKPPTVKNVRAAKAAKSDVKRTRKRSDFCTFEGCGKYRRREGYCRVHYNAFQAGELPVRTDPVAKATRNAGTKNPAKVPTLDMNVESNSKQSTATKRAIQTKSYAFATLDANKKSPSIRKVCKFEGCEKFSGAKSDEYCQRHSNEFHLEDHLKDNQTLVPPTGRDQPKPLVEESVVDDAAYPKIKFNGNDAKDSGKNKRLCRSEGCKKYIQRAGYCQSHHDALHLSENKHLASASTSKVKRGTTSEASKSPCTICICKLDGCEKYSQTKCDGYCHEHYNKFHLEDQLKYKQTLGSQEGKDYPTYLVEESLVDADVGPKTEVNKNDVKTSEKKKIKNPKRHCKFKGCKKSTQHKCDGYCKMHYKSTHSRGTTAVAVANNFELKRDKLVDQAGVATKSPEPFVSRKREPPESTTDKTPRKTWKKADNQINKARSSDKSHDTDMLLMKTVESSSISFDSDIDSALRDTHRTGVIHAIHPHKTSIISVFAWVNDKEEIPASPLRHYLNKSCFSSVRFIPYSSISNWLNTYPHAVIATDQKGTTQENILLHQPKKTMLPIQIPDETEIEETSQVYDKVDARNDTGSDGGKAKSTAATLEAETIKQCLKVNKQPKLFEAALLSNNERDQLHLEAYKYFQWLFKEITKLRSTREGKAAVKQAGIKYKTMENMLKKIDFVFKIKLKFADELPTAHDNMPQKESNDEESIKKSTPQNTSLHLPSRNDGSLQQSSQTNGCSKHEDFAQKEGDPLFKKLIDELEGGTDEGTGSAFLATSSELTLNESPPSLAKDTPPNAVLQPQSNTANLSSCLTNVANASQNKSTPQKDDSSNRMDLELLFNTLLGGKLRRRVHDKRLLGDPERDELHVEFYKYLKWLFVHLIEVHKTSIGRNKTRTFGIFVVPMKNLMEKLETTFKSINDAAQSMGEDYSPADAGVPFLEESLKDVLKKTSNYRVQARKAVPTKNGGRRNYVEELKLYKKEHGNCNVPSRAGALGAWLSEQRTLRRKGILPKKMVDILNSIGITWGFRKLARSWEENYVTLVDYQREHGHLNLPQNHDIFHWFRYQRKLFKKQDKVFMENHFHKLNELGFIWVHEKEKKSKATGIRKRVKRDFDDFYPKLKAFRDVHGHADVPYRYEDRELGKWVADVRRVGRKELKKERANEYDTQLESVSASSNKCIQDNSDSESEDDKKKSHWVGVNYLTKERRDKLDALGFTWKFDSSHTKSWEERLQELVEWKKQYGNYQVPRRYPFLGEWVYRQRFMFLAKDENFMKEKCALLNEIGFEWEKDRNLEPKYPFDDTA